MKFWNKKFNPDGLTFVELLVAVAIISLILLGLVTLNTSGQRYFITQSTRVDILRDGRYALNWISRDIKEAIKVLSSWDIYATSTSCLVLQVPSVDANGLIIDIENDFDHVIYRLNPQYPSKLEKIVDGKDGVSSRVDDSRAIVESINSFLLSSEGVELSSVSDFSQVSNIDIALTTRQSRFGRAYRETFNTGVKLRNKSVN